MWMRSKMSSLQSRVKQKHVSFCPTRSWICTLELAISCDVGLTIILKNSESTLFLFLYVTDLSFLFHPNTKSDVMSSQKKTSIASDQKFHTNCHDESALSDLFLANSLSTSWGDEGASVLMAREIGRPAMRKRQLSVSNLHYFVYYQSPKAYKITEIPNFLSSTSTC